jgi:predicted flap endonuclease-1-like 5' DNA nuclease
MNSPCIWIPLLVGAISGILGYLIGKMSAKPAISDDSAALRLELEKCRKNAATLLADLHAVNSAKSSGSTSKATNFAAPSAPLASGNSFDAVLAQSAMGKKIKADDLKVVEGIGPKIEELFHAAGIKTWKQLGEASVENCNKILHDAGPRFTMHDAGSWPKQSMLAYENKWKELKTLQDKLSGGR